MKKKAKNILVTIIFLMFIIYFIISYSMFSVKKPLLDVTIELPELYENTQRKKIDQITKSKVNQVKDNVAIQTVINDEKKDAYGQEILDNSPIDNKFKRNFALPEMEKIENLIVLPDEFDNQNICSLDSYSFVTLPIKDNYIIDKETQNLFDVLIGDDLDEFVKLVLQSNNNILTKDACRSCGMYAFFSLIKKHQKLTINEIVILQKILANLYSFVEKMKALSKKTMMNQEQYAALQDLNRSQAIKNDTKLQARRAATSAVLKKLQAIQYNR